MEDLSNKYRMYIKGELENQNWKNSEFVSLFTFISFYLMRLCLILKDCGTYNSSNFGRYP